MAVGIVGINKVSMRKGVGVERLKVLRKGVWKGMAKDWADIFGNLEWSCIQFAQLCKPWIASTLSMDGLPKSLHFNNY